MIEARAADAFRAAVRAHRARIAPLGEIVSAEMSVHVAGGAVVVRADVKLR
jgi:hypothetical protein